MTRADEHQADFYAVTNYNYGSYILNHGAHWRMITRVNDYSIRESSGEPSSVRSRVKRQGTERLTRLLTELGSPIHASFLAARSINDKGEVCASPLRITICMKPKGVQREYLESP